MLGGILIGLAVLAFFAYSRVCGGGGCDTDYCASGQKFSAPEGYELVSKVFELNAKKAAAPDNSNALVQLPLKSATTDQRNLSFYQYVASTSSWETLAPAILDPQGKMASATLQETPAIIAVMRRLLPSGHVAAYLPHNAPLHRDAVGRVTLVHTFDFAPAADGTVTGELSGITSDGSFAFYPVISVKAGDKGAIPTVVSILGDAATRSNHVLQIVNLVNEKKLGGINIAYMDLPADQRTAFALFISELGQRLHSQNKLLTLTIPSPIVVQGRVDEGAYDWAELGKAADVLAISPLRDQSSYRNDMPRVLEHLASLVKPSKLLLTVTPYATVKTVDGIETLRLSDAMARATRMSIGAGGDEKIVASSVVEIVGTNIDREENLSGIVWQPETATVAFTYKSGTPRTVWLENFFSVGFKLELIPRYKLGGVAVENASDDVYLGNIWTALVPFITSGQPILMQPNPADLLPRWTVSKGTIEGGERAGQKGRIKWSTPAEPGTYTIKLTLSDGSYYFENEVAVTVQPREARTPTATVTATPTN
ncbi:MAG: hypothetical protein HUU14_00480 [Dehalococcoidia bacterium]|nr:hypothetical protein [Chloroflexi bacterium CFX7]MCK6564617.1 hypothetical protein [Dehalococcoidia bacterium]NUQ54344.1 hypothetical protein [Dehalococcoidia bacterium]RIL01740.1 MAG: hypothetical protein DCC78_09910 [bacterium]